MNSLRENRILKFKLTLSIRLKSAIDNLSQLSHANLILKSPQKSLAHSIPMGEITVDPKGVLKLSNNLNIHKASGPDCLSARVLKECSSKISPMLALIYNESLAQGTVPDDWRQAIVSPVFKKGEKYNAANYRPVPLSPIHISLAAAVHLSTNTFLGNFVRQL